MQKVTGERIAAAIIDAVIIGILAIAITVIALIPEGFDGFVDMMLGAGGLDDSFEPSDSYLTFLLASTIGELVLGVIYFVLIPFKMNGQTLGKKFLSIKAINEFGENPNLKQHFIRSVQNWSAYFAAPFVFLAYSNYIAYVLVAGLLANIAIILLIVAFIMLIAREDGKGLHDLMANTRVVKVDFDINKKFVEQTSQMSDWAEVVDEDDQGFMENKQDDEW